MDTVARADEIDNLGKDPDQCVGNEVFFHDPVSFGIPSRVGIAGAHETVAIDLQPGFCPKQLVIRIQPRLSLVNDWQALAKHSKSNRDVWTGHSHAAR